jgi:hypothetical protein
MAPEPRTTQNRPLPARWRPRFGTYYYRVPPGQEHQWDGKTEFPLGRTLNDA